MKKFWIILEAAQTIVASGTKKLAHTACFVAMIYFEYLFSTSSFVDAKVSFATDGTCTLLRNDQGVVLDLGNPVQLFSGMSLSFFPSERRVSQSVLFIVGALLACSSQIHFARPWTHAVAGKIDHRQNLFASGAMLCCLVWALWRTIAVSANSALKLVATIFADVSCSFAVAVVVGLEKVMRLMLATLTTDFSEKISRIALHHFSYGWCRGVGLSEPHAQFRSSYSTGFVNP